jgi:uncharacterized protein (PEP-CTERM system associated)
MATTRTTASRKCGLGSQRLGGLARSGPRRMGPSKLSGTAVMLSGLSLFSSPTVDADTFRAVPSVTVQETLTNNVDLAPSPNTRADLITEITPTITINETGGRTRLSGTVSLPTVLYARSGSENNHVYGQANLTGNVEAVDKFFFIDGAVSVSQQYFSPFGAQPVGLANATQNRYTAQSYSVSPYIQGGTPSTVQYKLRDDNIWTNLTNTSADVPGSYTNVLSGTVSKEYAHLGWAAEYNRSEVRFHSEFPQLTQVGRLRLTDTVDPTLQLFVTGGYEDDDYVVSTFHSAIYGVGGSWRPTPRTNLNASWEHRFFGASYSFDFSHRMPLSVWSLSATRNLTSYPQLIASLPSGSDARGTLNLLLLASIPDPVERAAFIEQFIRGQAQSGLQLSPVNIFSVQNTIDERATASLGLLGARNTIYFSGFYVRTRQISAIQLPVSGIVNPLADSAQKGASIVWTHRLKSNVTFALDGAVSRSVPKGQETTVGPATQGSLTASLSYPLSPKTTVTGGARYQAFRPTAMPGYTEAAVFAGLTYTFH